MPRDVSGNYTLPSGVNPVVNNTLIDVAWANPTLSDIATQLNNVLTRDGLLGPILPLKLVDGTVGAPALCFGSQPTTGFYKTTNGFGFGISGTNVLNVTSTEFQIVGKTGIGSATGSNVGLYVYKSGSAGGTNDSGLFVRQDGTDPIAIFSGNGGAVLVNAGAALNSAANRGNVTVDGTASSIVSFGKSGANIGYVYADATKMQFGSFASLPIELITGNAARVTVDASGFVGFGKVPTGGYALDIADISSAVCLGTFRNGTTTAYHAIFNNGNGQVGGISTNGSATNFATTSDYRLKNITGDLQTSGDFIDALQPRVGTWKADNSPFVGFVAHELQAVSPSSVNGEKDGEQMQSVGYGSAELIANIVAELKSLRARVAALEGLL